MVFLAYQTSHLLPCVALRSDDLTHGIPFQFAKLPGQPRAQAGFGDPFRLFFDIEGQFCIFSPAYASSVPSSDVIFLRMASDAVPQCMGHGLGRVRGRKMQFFSCKVCVDIACENYWLKELQKHGQHRDNLRKAKQRRDPCSANADPARRVN